MIPSLQDMIDLIRVGRGELEGDLIIKGCRVYNPFTLELLEEDVVIYKKWIAFVGKFKGRVKNELEFPGCIAIPGFIDPHAHPDLFYNPFTFSSFAAKLGVTSMLADIHDFSASVGLENMLRFIKRDVNLLPVKFFIAFPVINPPSPEVEGDWLVPNDLMEDVSKCERVFSVGEIVSWIRIYDGDRETISRLYPFFKRNKRIEGHTPGAKGEKLRVLAASGITSCHESVSMDDVLERLRVGWWVIIREGSIRREFSEIIPKLKGRMELFSRIMLTVDGIFADDLVEKGYMDFVVRRAVEEGLDPLWALRMVTLNPAEYMGVSRYLGSISPGKVADILIVDDLSDPRPKKVFINGEVYNYQSLDIPGYYKRPPFSVEIIEEKLFPRELGKVPVMYVVNKTITRLKYLELSNEADMREKDCNYIIMVHKESGEVGRGFIQNFGFLDGGFSISVSHEPHHIISIGGRRRDMILSLKRVLENGGGAAIYSGGKELFFLDLSMGGTMSFLSIPELAGELRMLRFYLKKLGSRLDDPLWCAVFLSLTGLPEVRITPRGMFHVKQKRVVYNG